MKYSYSGLTLNKLIKSAETEKYNDHPLVQHLLTIKPEFGTSRRICVRKQDGEVAVSNVHIGSLADILAYPIDVEDGLQLDDCQLLEAILAEIVRDGYCDGYNAEFWNEMTNLQRAKILR